MFTNKSNHWVTFDKRKVNISELTHQHLSNIIWYNRIFAQIHSIELEIMNELEKRFNGKILKYRPLNIFQSEIESLRSDGLLNDKGEIHFNGELIGYFYPHENY